MTDPLDALHRFADEKASGVRMKVAEMAPELPFDEIWTPEPEANLVIPAFGIAPGPTHLVTGSWYTGKTLLLATMGLCVASGRSLFGLYGVRRGKWIHFDHEMGRRHMKRYVQRLRNGMNIDPEELRGRMSLRVLPKLNLRTEGAVDLYTEILQGYSLATIDPLRAAAPGADENDSEFRQYQDMLAVVSDRTGCAIEVLHHGGKPTLGSQRRNTGRGTSAIDDAAQSKFVLTAEEKGAPMLVTHEKTRELAQPLEDFYLEVVNGPDSVLLMHRNAEEMADRKEETDAKRQAAQAERARGRIMRALAGAGGRFTGKRGDFLELIGGDRRAVSPTLSRMLDEGMIRSEGRGDERVWYSV